MYSYTAVQTQKEGRGISGKDSSKSYQNGHADLPLFDQTKNAMNSKISLRLLAVFLCLVGLSAYMFVQNQSTSGNRSSTLKYSSQLYMTDACNQVSYYEKAKCCSSTNFPVLGGVDVVAFKYLEEGQVPVMGSIENAAALPTDSGGLYVFFFQNPQNQAAFMTDPWAYVPQWGGFDAWGIAESDFYKGDAAKDKLGPSVDLSKWQYSATGELLFFGKDENFNSYVNGDPSHYKVEGDRKWEGWFPGKEDGIFNTRCISSPDFDTMISQQDQYADLSYMETIKSGPEAAFLAASFPSKEEKDRSRGGGGGGGAAGPIDSSKFTTSAQLTEKERRKGDSIGMLYYVHYGEGTIERIYMEDQTGKGFWNDVLLEGLAENASPKDVTISMEEDKFYWTDLVAGTIMRCPLKGVASSADSECEVLVTGQPKPALLRLDLANEQMFFTDMKCPIEECDGEFVIRKAGTRELNEPELVVDLGGQSMGITLHEGYLYYTDYYDMTLSRVPLDATPESVPEVLIENLDQPKYMDIEDGKVFWVDHDATAVRYAPMDDFVPHDLLTGLDIVANLQVKQGGVFWSDKNGYIFRADLGKLLESDGLDYTAENTEIFTTVVDGLLKPKGFDLVFWPAPDGLDVSASTKYTERGDPPVYNDYKWCPGPIVEPYMKTTFRPNEAREGHSYEWDYHGKTYKGIAVQLTLKKVGLYPLVLREKNSETGEVTRVKNTALTVKYVRREIRQLMDEDREAYLDAMEVMVKLPKEEGLKQYGPDYQDMTYYVALHNNNAGARDCDHMHNGMGFLTQHMGLTLEFDQGLQLINPAVTTPYWDFTIDGHEIYEKHDGDFDALWNSPVFRPDWFGQMDPETHTITEGRWAWAHKVADDQWGVNPVHNSYGMMRAPWNNNNFPYIQRFRTLGGIPVWNVHEGWPTCESHHFAITNYNAWLQFSLKVASQPHGSVHGIMGGTFGNEWAYDLLEEFMDEEDVFTLRAHSYNSPKNLWRRGLSECPERCEVDTPPSECKCSCGDDLMEKLEDPELLDEYYDAASAGKNKMTGDYDDETKKRMIEIICNAGTSIGDQLESASPADVLFWPIHPTVERLTMWRLIRAGFSDWGWPEDYTQNYRGSILLSAEKEGDVECYGHAADDIMPWNLNLDDGKTEMKQYTNMEFLKASDPTAGYLLPYVYDRFNWDHCSDEGFDFNI